MVLELLHQSAQLTGQPHMYVCFPSGLLPVSCFHIICCWDQGEGEAREGQKGPEEGGAEQDSMSTSLLAGFIDRAQDGKTRKATQNLQLANR